MRTEKFSTINLVWRAGFCRQTIETKNVSKINSMRIGDLFGRRFMPHVCMRILSNAYILLSHIFRCLSVPVCVIRECVCCAQCAHVFLSWFILRRRMDVASNAEIPRNFFLTQILSKGKRREGRTERRRERQRQNKMKRFEKQVVECLSVYITQRAKNSNSRMNGRFFFFLFFVSLSFFWNIRFHLVSLDLRVRVRVLYIFRQYMVQIQCTRPASDGP